MRHFNAENPSAPESPESLQCPPRPATFSRMKFFACLTVAAAGLFLSSCAADCGCGTKRKAAPAAHTGGPRVAVDTAVTTRTN